MSLHAWGLQRGLPSQLLGFWLTPHPSPPTNNWRWASFLVQNLLLLSLIRSYYFPESPRLAVKKKLFPWTFMEGCSSSSHLCRSYLCPVLTPTLLTAPPLGPCSYLATLQIITAEAKAKGKSNERRAPSVLCCPPPGSWRTEERGGEDRSGDELHHIPPTLVPGLPPTLHSPCASCPPGLAGPILTPRCQPASCPLLLPPGSCHPVCSLQTPPPSHSQPSLPPNPTSHKTCPRPRVFSPPSGCWLTTVESLFKQLGLSPQTSSLESCPFWRCSERTMRY